MKPLHFQLDGRGHLSVCANGDFVETRHLVAANNRLDRILTILTEDFGEDVDDTGCVTLTKNQVEALVKEIRR